MNLRESAEQIAMIRELWRDGHRRGYIAEQAGISPRRLDALKEHLNLPRRQRGSQGGPSLERCPSPLEIRARAAELRARWTEEDYSNRYVGSRMLSATELAHTPLPPGRTANSTRPLPAEGRL